MLKKSPTMKATTRIHTNDSDAVIIGLYIIFFIYFSVNRGKSYRGHHKRTIPLCTYKTHVIELTTSDLPWHVLAGITELTLYYCNFNCTLLAVLACYAQSLTSLSLVKRLPNGYPPHTRKPYPPYSIPSPQTKTRKTKKQDQPTKAVTSSACTRSS